MFVKLKELIKLFAWKNIKNSYSVPSENFLFECQWMKSVLWNENKIRHRGLKIYIKIQYFKDPFTAFKEIFCQEITKHLYCWLHCEVRKLTRRRMSCWHKTFRFTFFRCLPFCLRFYDHHYVEEWIFYSISCKTTNFNIKVRLRRHQLPDNLKFIFILSETE